MVKDQDPEVYTFKINWPSMMTNLYIVIVIYPELSFRNNAHSIILVFCETNVKDPQYRTEEETYHCLCQYNPD